jgi:hypothetical protein
MPAVRCFAVDLANALGEVAAPVAAAIAAVGSWWAAARSNQVTRGLAAIERDRRHDELAPDFEVTCTERDTAPDQAFLRVALKRGHLERLDEVIITIQDEAGQEHWVDGLPDGVTQEQAEAFVWGPWDFNVGAGAQVAGNRTTNGRPYSIVTGKNWDVLALNRTRPGHWMGSATTQESWRRRYADQPLRLLITCRRDGYEPWTLPYEVGTERRRPPKIRILGEG